MKHTVNETQHCSKAQNASFADFKAQVIDALKTCIFGNLSDSQLQDISPKPGDRAVYNDDPQSQSPQTQFTKETAHDRL